MVLGSRQQVHPLFLQQEDSFLAPTRISNFEVTIPEEHHAAGHYSISSDRFQASYEVLGKQSRMLEICKLGRTDSQLLQTASIRALAAVA